MFRQGKVLKVKVELSPDVVGFGRATIVELDGGHIFLQLRTSKGEKRNLPKGTKVWFVSDSPDNPFNGLWSTTILSSKNIQGKASLECARPKFEQVVQRRRHKRVSCSYKVSIKGEKFEKLEAATRNLSSSGAGIEVYDDCVHLFSPGHYIDVTIDSPSGPIACNARVIVSRFNWLGNKTDVGLEFLKVAPDDQDRLEKQLASMGGQPRLAPAGKEKDKSPVNTGQLSHWLKSTKDNVSFVKAGEGSATSVLSEEDLDELEDDDNDFDDEHVTD